MLNYVPENPSPPFQVDRLSSEDTTEDLQLKWEAVFGIFAIFMLAMFISITSITVYYLKVIPYEVFGTRLYYIKSQYPWN